MNTNAQIAQNAQKTSVERMVELKGLRIADDGVGRMFVGSPDGFITRAKDVFNGIHRHIRVMRAWRT